ncbi:MAG: DUF4325 domain-containing protein [Clostridia bacterium]|nr:DUF4325 domain-containing protein [Clostridia bacterium]
MSKENREQIVSYILKLISAKDKDVVKKTTEAFDISKSTVYNYIKELCENGILKNDGSKYEIISKSYKFVYENKMLDETRVFDKDIAPLFKNLEGNAIRIWRYAFSEMMNNAIEHSCAESILVLVQTNPLEATVIICDNGVGIFKHIQEYMLKEQSKEIPLEECATLLFAGKFTTAKSMHSGEGIFFTSHLMDSFFILSDDIVFSRNNFKDSQIKIADLKNKGGTIVCMSLNNHTKKTAKEVFDRFSNMEDGFVKTQIPIAHIFPYGSPVSRSEGRRLGELISKFKEVNLDFADVEEVGQAFCHEVFIVWQSQHVDIKLNILNANEDVDWMIRRVKNTKYD